MIILPLTFKLTVVKIEAPAVHVQLQIAQQSGAWAPGGILLLSPDAYIVLADALHRAAQDESKGFRVVFNDQKFNDWAKENDWSL